MKWCANGHHWWQESYEVRTGGGGRCFTVTHFYTLRTSWSLPLTLNSCRGRFSHSPGFSTWWVSIPMSWRQSGFSDTPSARSEPSWRWPMCDKWRESYLPTVPPNGYRRSAHTVERTRQRGHLHPTDRHSMALSWDLSGRPTSGELYTYRISFPSAVGAQDCPVKVCKGRAATRAGIHINFLHQHVWETVIIVGEGNLRTHGVPTATCWCYGQT